MATCLVKSDNEIKEVEIQHINKFIDKSFSTKVAVQYKLKLKETLSKTYNLDKVIEVMNYDVEIVNNYNTGTFGKVKKHKLKWLHFLISIATADGLLANKEMEMLEKIRIAWGIHENTFNSILAMFNYVQEEYIKQQYSETKKASFIRQTNSLDLAYKVLELTPGVSFDLVKNKYRELAQKYHPDKLLNANDLEKQQAKEMFLKVKEAYAVIKSATKN